MENLNKNLEVLTTGIFQQIFGIYPSNDFEDKSSNGPWAMDDKRMTSFSLTMHLALPDKVSGINISTYSISQTVGVANTTHQKKVKFIMHCPECK